MKIVRKDNYDREGPWGDEHFVAENIKSKHLAEVMCRALNNIDPHGNNFYVVAEDDYVLPPPWEP